MAGLKEIRNRIVSISSTKQITSAMKMVAAAKLKKAQDSVTQIRPYANKLKEILAKVSTSLDKEHSGKYTQTRNAENILIVLLASNSGLCGVFNNNVCKKAVEYVEEVYPKQSAKGNVKFICIGKKANEFIEKQKYEIIKSGNELFEDLSFSNIAPFAEYIMKLFTNNDFDKVDIVYNSFKNAAVYNQKIEQYLPMTLDLSENNKSCDFIFEPSVESIIEEMIPKSLKMQFLKIVLDSFATEQGARMTAMHQATDNATELIKDLTLVYNKARQASITNELIEITSGAEALK